MIAPAATAAQVRVDRACVPPRDPVAVSGAGFTPGVAFAVSVDGLPLGGGTVDDAGLVGASFPAPSATGAHVVVARDLQGNQGRARLRVARAAGRVTPLGAGARRARFAVEGFGPARPRVYLHWVTPGGRVRGPAVLGRAAGACGALRVTRRLLPDARPARGAWRLQLDTRRSYSPRSTPRVVQNLRVR
jgi:hypothetical protein